MIKKLILLQSIFDTSGFWPRVRARALRAPVFLDSLPRQTGRCAPPAHRSFAASYSIPKNRLKTIELVLRPSASWAFFVLLDHRGEIWGPLPSPRQSQLRWSFWRYEEKGFYFYACKTHIGHSEGFFEGASLFFTHLGSKLCILGATILPKFASFILFNCFILFSCYSLLILLFSSLLILLVLFFLFLLFSSYI